MLVNLSDVLTSEGKVEKITAELEMMEYSAGLGSFSVMEKSLVEFTFTNIGVGKAKVEGNVSITFATECDRCLAEVPTKLELQFDRVVTAPDVTEDEDDERPDYMEGYQLDVEAFVYSEILINWPVKILCKEECKGVCLKCGQNLNTRECGCDTFVPDPRMAVLKDIFNANKEV